MLVVTENPCPLQFHFLSICLILFFNVWMLQDVWWNDELEGHGCDGKVKKMIYKAWEWWHCWDEKGGCINMRVVFHHKENSFFVCLFVYLINNICNMMYGLVIIGKIIFQPIWWYMLCCECNKSYPINSQFCYICV